jgi:hypothetical protein
MQAGPAGAQPDPGNKGGGGDDNVIDAEFEKK